MKKPKAPCKGCEKRSESCRITCKEWNKYREDKAVWDELVLTEKKKATAVRVGKGKMTWIR